MPAPTNPPRIFISYARSDGENVARDLRGKLEGQGFSLWQDRTQLEGCKEWWDQIVSALKQVEYMVLVITPASIKSDIVRKEWRLARQEGVGVLPIIGRERLDFDAMPRWMRDQHFVDPNSSEQWTRFLRTLESPYQGTRVPFMAEDLPDGFVPRPDEFRQLLEGLLDQARDEPVAITAALRGAGGYGKTTLAKALCHDEQIQDAFHDGILWVTLGEQPNIMAGLTKLYAALTDERPNFVDEEDASTKLAEIMGEKDYLMVIDDVWNAAHVRPFLRGGKRCARIITTRDSTTLPQNARLRVDVDAMHQNEALDLLAFELPEGEAVALQTLATELGEWPFLLKLVNGTLRDRVNIMKQSLPDALHYVNKALKKRGLTAFDARDPVERNQAVAVTLAASFDHLKKEELARYQELAIFPEDVEIPLTAITKLWGATGELDDFDTEELCTRLKQLSLVLKYDPTTQRIQLHDVVRTYLEEQCTSRLTQLHGKFLDAYGLEDELQKSAEDTYLCRYVAYHLVKAERKEELKKLLLNVDWLYAKLEAMDVPALLSDFEWICKERPFRLIQEAIRLSAHVIGMDSSQLPGQLLGRLETIKSSELDGLLQATKSWNKTGWLRPLKGSLIAPGGPLIRTLSGYERSGVQELVCTKDGRCVISASGSVLTVWDLANGLEIHTLERHRNTVNALAVTSDNRYVISASDDKTLIMWDLASGQIVHTLSGHCGYVVAVTITPDGQRAISSSGNILKVWDLSSGQEALELKGHGATVTAVAVTPDGERVISASQDQTLKVWELANGQEVHTLRGHSGYASSVTITPDGRHVISGFGYELVVFDLASNLEIQTLIGHHGAVRFVMVTADGTRAISAAADHTLKVWDLESGKVTYSLSRTRDWMNAVTVTPDGTRAVSTSGDGTLKVWDLSNINIEEIHIPNGHQDVVNAVRVTGDSKRVISVSDDASIKVWDTLSGEECYTLHGRSRYIVNTVTVTPDGKRAIWGSVDGTIKVWDLSSMEEVHTFRSSGMGVLAVTPNSKCLISTNSYGIPTFWDLESGEKLYTLSEDIEEVRKSAVAVTPDGRQVILASRERDGVVKVWDVTSGSAIRTLDGPRGWFNSVQVTPDGTRVISVLRVGAIKVWDLASGKEIQTLSGTRDWFDSVTADGTHAISILDDRMIKIWDLASETVIHTLRGHESGGNAVTLTLDGTYAISASRDGMLKVWNLFNVEEVLTQSAHRDSVETVLSVMNDSHVLSVSENGEVKVWDLASGEEVYALSRRRGWANAVTVTPDGSQVVSASKDGTLKLFDLVSGQERHSLSGHCAAVNAVTVSVDNKCAVSASLDGVVKVWSLSSGEDIFTLTGHCESVSEVMMTPGGREVISVSADSTLKVWDLDFGREICTLSGHNRSVNAVTMTGDGRQVITASRDRTLKVWELPRGREICTLSGHNRSVNAVTVTGDSRQVISASQDQTLRVWDLATGQEVKTLTGHFRSVNAVNIVLDGNYIVSASRDHTCNLWDLRTGHIVRTLIGHTGNINAVVVGRNSSQIVTVSDDARLKIWDLKSGKDIATFTGESPIMCCTVSPDGNTIVAGESSGRVHILRLEGVD